MAQHDNMKKIEIALLKHAEALERFQDQEDTAKEPANVEQRKQQVDKAVLSMMTEGLGIVKARAAQEPEEAHGNEANEVRQVKLSQARSFVLDMIEFAVDRGESQIRTRSSIEATEARRREMQKFRKEKELHLAEERLARQEARQKEAQEAAAAAEAAKAKEEEEAKAAKERQAKMDALKTIDQPEEEQGMLPDRIARFRQERRGREKGDEALNLRRWDNIEDELEQMMDMLHEEGPGVEQAYAMAQQEDDKYDFKYMYKYKYRALVLDDDQELPSLGGGPGLDLSRANLN